MCVISSCALWLLTSACDLTVCVFPCGAFHICDETRGHDHGEPYENKGSGVLQGSWIARVCRRRCSQTTCTVCSFHSRPGHMFRVQVSPKPSAFCVATMSPRGFPNLLKSDRGFTTEIGSTHPGRLSGNVPSLCVCSHHRGHEAFLSVRTPCAGWKPHRGASAPTVLYTSLSPPQTAAASADPFCSHCGRVFSSLPL